MVLDPRRIRRRRLARAIFAPCLALFSPALLACNPFGETTEEPKTSAAPTSAQEILDRYVEAIGGSEAARALAQRTIEAKLLFKGQPDCQEGDPNCIPDDTLGEFMLFTTADGRMFRSTVISEQILQHGFDGETGWQYQVEPPMLVLEEGIRASQTREDAVLHWYLDLDARGIEPAIQTARIDETTGETLDGLAWNARDKRLPTRVLWFDRVSGLLREEIEKDEISDAIERRYFSDYREVDGILVPYKWRQLQAAAGRSQEVEIEVTAVHHQAIADTRFKIPTLPTPEPVADERLAYLDSARAAAKSAPDDATAAIGLARMAFAAAHFEEATQAAKRALKLNRGDPEALWFLAQIQVLKGDLSVAAKTLARAKKGGLAPDKAARLLGWIKLRRGDWRGAGAQLHQAAISAPRAPEQPPETLGPFEATLDALGGRYAAFRGKPLQRNAKGCAVTLPLRVEKDAMVVEVTADAEVLKLLVDTAAPDIIISDSLAKRMVVGRDADAPLIVGGRTYPRGQIDEVSLGALTIRNVPATIFTDEEMLQTAGDSDVDGILGLAVLAPWQITFDLQGSSLTLIKNSKACRRDLAKHRQGEAIPFWFHESHHLYVLAEMNDAEGLYLFNSGMRGADLTANELAYAHAGIGTPPIRQGVVPMVDIKRFRVGPHQSKDLIAAFGFINEIFTSDGFRLDGMIGLGALSKGAITLDFDEHRIYQRAPKDNQQAPTTNQTAPKGD